MIKILLGLGKEFGKNKIEIVVVVMFGMKKFMNYEKNFELFGIEVLKNVDKDEKVFIMISRVYNIVDLVLNMGIENELKKCGYKVFYLIYFEVLEMNIGEEYLNMYWFFGQYIIIGVKIIKNYKNLFFIYIINYGCGLDIILIYYFKKEMGSKFYLYIEVDEYFLKVGVIIRVEVFINLIKNYESNELFVKEIGLVNEVDKIKEFGVVNDVNVDKEFDVFN